LGKVDASFQEPHGVFATLVFDAAPILRAKLPTQKLYIFLLRTLPHIKYRNAFCAIGFVSACAERQVDDCLRHRAGWGQNTGGGVCRSFIYRRVAAHIE